MKADQKTLTVESGWLESEATEEQQLEKDSFEEQDIGLLEDNDNGNNILTTEDNGDMDGENFDSSQEHRNLSLHIQPIANPLTLETSSLLR